MAYQSVIIFSDGAARGNPGPAGAGAYITSGDGEVVAEVSEYLGEMTNNQAEYRASKIKRRIALPMRQSIITLRLELYAFTDN